MSENSETPPNDAAGIDPTLGINGLPSPEEINAAAVNAEWHWSMPEELDINNPHQPLGWVDLSFPGIDPDEFNAGFGGTIVLDRSSDKKVMNAATLILPKELEGHHLGEKLTRTLGYEAVQQGCDEIDVDFRHPASLKAFIKVFGFERVHFYGSGDLPSTEEGAVELVTENWRNPRKSPGKPSRLQDVREARATIDLTGLDTSQWEVPVEIGASREF